MGADSGALEKFGEAVTHRAREEGIVTEAAWGNVVLSPIKKEQRISFFSVKFSSF